VSENLSYSVGSPDSETSFLAVAERIARQKRLGTDPVQNVDGSGKPLPGSAMDVLTRLRERTLDSATLLSQPPGEWHVRGLIKQGQFGLLGGKWKSGKTLAGIHAAKCVSLGTPWAPGAGKDAKNFGEITKPGNVLYVASEGGGALRNRVDAWQRLHDPEGRLAAASPFQVFWFLESVNLLSDEHVAALKTFAAERKIVFLIVDTLSSSISGSEARGGNPENDNALMTKLSENAAAIAAHIGGSGFFICHPPKGDDSGTRGAGALEASARFKINVAEKAGGGRCVSLAFNNEASTEGVESFFKIEPVEVGRDEQGEAITAPAYMPTAGTHAGHASPQGIMALHAIAGALNGEGQIDRPTATEALKLAGIKTGGRVILSRLLADGWMEGVGAKNRRGGFDLFQLSNAGRMKVGLCKVTFQPGDSRLPLDERKPATPPGDDSTIDRAQRQAEAMHEELQDA
jgi:hypothetical protein